MIGVVEFFCVFAWTAPPPENTTAPHLAVLGGRHAEAAAAAALAPLLLLLPRGVGDRVGHKLKAPEVAKRRRHGGVGGAVFFAGQCVEMRMRDREGRKKEGGDRPRATQR